MADSLRNKKHIADEKFWLGEDELLEERQKVRRQPGSRKNAAFPAWGWNVVALTFLPVISLVVFFVFVSSSVENARPQISKVEISNKKFNLDTEIPAERNKLIIAMFSKKEFPQIETALANGEKILESMKSKKNQKLMASLVGSEIVFYGSGAPPGGNANLLIEKNVLLEVKMKPDADPRPQAVMWTAIVYGVLKSADVKKGIVRIQTTKKNWRVVETW